MTKIFMTLPPSYQHFNTAWESATPEMRTLSNLVARLSMEELRSNSHGNEGNSASSAKARHYQGRKPSNNHKKDSNCFKCGRPGHWKKECRSRTDKTGNRKQIKPEERGGAFIGEVIEVKILISQHTTESWYLDSGASQHMSPTRQWFINYQELPKPTQVRIGNGDVIFAVGKGKIDILAFDGSQWKRKYLAEVLYVPKLKCNLFSLSSALDKGLKLSSDNQRCVLRRGGSIVAVRDRQENLYLMRFRPFLPDCEENKLVCARVEKSESLNVWHQKLVHQNIVHVRKMLSKWGVKVEDESEWFCEGCTLGKMSRKHAHKSLQILSTLTYVGQWTRYQLENPGIFYCLRMITRITR